MSRIAVIAEFETEPGSLGKFRELMAKHAAASRAEPGCLRFDVLVPEEGKDRLMLFELWSDRAALDTHAATDRIKAHRQATRPLVAHSRIELCAVYDSGDA